ncbi:four helix bundle protein [Marichromatium sp. AB32]|uniref:four helix bundle protein n=1 Tax=Marichromatium sp. AB32 TaxID=2483363 RepID=UPI000F3C9B0E|nr:four helix bundle protein [Marichromatium sp. AB32]RNE92695.1 four helix bundle protein [Marichromatium sp. AB32]
MRDYRKLSVWHKAHALTLAIYETTQGFPPSERFGLVPQMRRAASSVPSNLAEGCGRGSDADFARFVRIAAGSVNELEYQCLLARDLHYLPAAHADERMRECAEIRRMLAGLLTSLAPPTPHPPSPRSTPPDEDAR